MPNAAPPAISARRDRYIFFNVSSYITTCRPS
jgi:hypothetical protein